MDECVAVSVVDLRLLRRRFGIADTEGGKELKWTVRKLFVEPITRDQN